MSLYFRFVRWLHQFEEHPNYNRVGAGLYTLLWVRYCGWSWKEAWLSACIYWFNRKPRTYGRKS